MEELKHYVDYTYFLVHLFPETMGPVEQHEMQHTGAAFDRGN